MHETLYANYRQSNMNTKTVVISSAPEMYLQLLVLAKVLNLTTLDSQSWDYKSCHRPLENIYCLTQRKQQVHRSTE